MKKLLIVFMFIGVSLYAIERWAGWYMVIGRSCVPLSEVPLMTPDKKAWCAIEYGKDRLFLECSLGNKQDYWSKFYYFRTLEACKQWTCDGCPGEHYVAPPSE